MQNAQNSQNKMMSKNIFFLLKQSINILTELKIRISQKKYAVLDSSKKRTLGQFYVLKIAPAFVFWKNPGCHNLLLRFTDL